MTILVTGGTGRVGSRFVPRLLQHTDAVRVLVRDAGRAEPLARLGAEVVVGDLRDTTSVDKALAGVDVVVHLGAAFRGVADEVANTTNHTATVDLATASLRAGVSRFVNGSTILVSGTGHGRPTAETDEPAPANLAYPASKAAAERDLLRLHRTEGLPLSIVRLPFVYGEGDPHLAESVRWAQNWPLHKRLHMAHHADVGQALLLVIEAADADGEIFNVGDDAPVTGWELLRLNDEPIDESAAHRELGDPWEGIADTTKIRRELGFRPIYPTVYTAKDAGAL